MFYNCAALAIATTSLFATVHASPARLRVRQDCQQTFTACSPPDSTEDTLPPVGSDLADLYVDLLDSVKDVKTSKRSAPGKNEGLIRRDAPSLCCAEITACLNIKDYNVPMCYDRFTTNFYLPDGSTGTLTSGDYHGPDNTYANLVNGSFTAGGSSGNIYGGDNPPPDTAALPVPTPYTAAGEGSAIPLTALGGGATYTTTIPGTTVAATTIAATTDATVTVAATTIPGTTMQGGTVVVTNSAVASSTSAAAAAATAALPTRVVAGAAGAFVAALAVL